jgi:hypothetical protein
VFRFLTLRFLPPASDPALSLDANEDGIEAATAEPGRLAKFEAIPLLPRSAGELA